MGAFAYFIDRLTRLVGASCSIMVPMHPYGLPNDAPDIGSWQLCESI